MFQEEKIRRFGRVDFEAGERVGVANAPQPNTHRTAMPTVPRFVSIFEEKILGVGFWHEKIARVS